MPWHASDTKLKHEDTQIPNPLDPRDRRIFLKTDDRTTSVEGFFFALLVLKEKKDNSRSFIPQPYLIYFTAVRREK